jgi:hypothetical protein
MLRRLVIAGGCADVVVLRGKLNVVRDWVVGS